MPGLKFLVSTLILIAAAVFVGAQGRPGPDFNEAAENPVSSIKVDEFGPLGHCDFSARIDNLYIQLQNNAGATAYIITYRSADALPGDRDRDRMAANAMAHLRISGLDTSRVVFIDGGFRPDIGAELFIVPSGGIPPEPTETVERPETPKGTFLWSVAMIQTEQDFEEIMLEEFVLPEVSKRRAEERRQEELEWEAELAKQQLEDPENTEAGSGVEIEEDQQDDTEVEEVEEATAEEVREARFFWIDQKFAEEVFSRKGSRGVIIFYADDREFDIGELRGFVEESRDEISLQAKIEAALIEIVFGGYSHSPSAQFYVVVAEGADNPEPEPDERMIVEEEAEKQPNQNHGASQG